jgi:putative lipoprotein
VRPLLLPLTAAALLAVSAPALAAPPDPDPWFGRDKALHFSVSAGIAGLGYGTTALFTSDLRIRMAFGGGVAIAAGAGKELLDLTGLGDPSWKDFAWDVLGTVVGVGISIAIDTAVRGIHPGYGYPR